MAVEKLDSYFRVFRVFRGSVLFFSDPNRRNLTRDKQVKASDSIGGYKFMMNITRMGMPQFKVQMQRDGGTTCSDIAFGTSSPIEVTVTPTTPGQPERVLVRAILLEKNVAVGQPSDPTFVTVNP